MPARTRTWPQLNIRIPPELHSTLLNALQSPLYLRLPHGKVQEFVTLAIRRELERRGYQCDTQSTSSSTQTGTTTQESSSGSTTPLDYLEEF